MDVNNPPCPECGNPKTHKKMLVVFRSGARKQRYRCPKCGLTFYNTEAEA